MFDYAELSDLQLLEMAASGSRGAEEQLAERYMQLVRVCARPLFLVGGDSEDLIQEGTFGLVSAIRQYKPDCGASFRTFAELCIRKRLYSAVKSASRLKHFPLNDGMSLEQLSEESDHRLSAIPAQRSNTPEDLVLARESKEELYRALSDRLSTMEKRVLSLYLDGFHYQDIAQRLGKDTKAIDNAVQRIRRKLARDPEFGEISGS